MSAHVIETLHMELRHPHARAAMQGHALQERLMRFLRGEGLKQIERLFDQLAPQLRVVSQPAGHLLGGAGGVESVFTVLAVHEQKSPPTINIFEQDPECDLDYCANTARDMRIDVAVNNNFGFGGTNGSLVFRKV